MDRLSRKLVNRLILNNIKKKFKKKDFNTPLTKADIQEWVTLLAILKYFNQKENKDDKKPAEPEEKDTKVEDKLKQVISRLSIDEENYRNTDTEDHERTTLENFLEKDIEEYLDNFNRLVEIPITHKLSTHPPKLSKKQVVQEPMKKPVPFSSKGNHKKTEATEVKPVMNAPLLETDLSSAFECYEDASMISKCIQCSRTPSPQTHSTASIRPYVVSESRLVLLRELEEECTETSWVTKL